MSMTESEVIAMASKRRTMATWLTGAVGLLILAAAFVIMACSAPSLASPRPHAAVAQAASVPISAVSERRGASQ
jgi:hypothetical protein